MSNRKETIIPEALFHAKGVDLVNPVKYSKNHVLKKQIKKIIEKCTDIEASSESVEEYDIKLKYARS